MSPSTSRLRLSVRATDARVELAATTTLRRCLLALEQAAVPVPVPVEQWIERPLGFQFGVADDEELGSGVLGVARTGTGEILIAQSLLVHEGRFRFTCAHELGHMVMHRTIHAEFQDEELPRAESTTEIEREADRFASAMLMPLDTIAEQFERIRVESGLSEACYAMLQGADVLAVWLWRRCFVPALAERYGVSKPALVYRCRELRLPGQRRLLRPSLVPLLIAPERAIAELELDAVRIVDGVPRL